MTHVNSRVQKHREVLPTAGLRPIKLWVPYTRCPNFAEECHGQSRIAAEADKVDKDMQHFMDEAWIDLEDWTE